MLLYQESLSQLWGRASRYNDPQSAVYIEPRYREVGEFTQQGFVYWPGIPHYKPAVPAESAPSAVAGGAAPAPHGNL